MDELQSLARGLGLDVPNNVRKSELAYRVMRATSNHQGRGQELAQGVLDIVEDGYGFLRQERFLPGPNDIYVSQSQIRRFALRTGDYVTGAVRSPKDSEKYYGLLRVETVNGLSPDVARQRPHFDALTPIFPVEQLILETEPRNLTQRVIDLVAPIGKGQRGLIVSPPKAGKTTILKHIANGISRNHPDVHMMAVLVGE